MDSKELIKFAGECLALARRATTPEERERLRGMAREMLEVAGQAQPAATTQQQQQIQTKTERD